MFIETAEQVERFLDREFLGQTRLLEGNAESLPQGFVVLSPAAAEDLDVPGRGRQQTFQDFDGRGLTGSVRSKQAETFAGVHLQVQAVDRVHWSRAARVALPQVTGQDGGCHHTIILLVRSP